MLSVSNNNKELSSKKAPAEKDSKADKVRPVKSYQEPEIFVLNNSKFIQSNIYFYIPSKTVDAETKVQHQGVNELVEAFYVSKAEWDKRKEQP